MKNVFTGLFRFARKSLMTTDNDMGAFRDKLNELVDQKDTLSDEDIVARVEEIKKLTDDLPENDGKASLIRFLEDFKAVKEQSPETAKKAADAVAAQFEKLDTAAMQDVPEEFGTEPEAETAEEVTEETVAPEGEEVPGEEEVTEEESETAEDADPNAEYSLEEIYQFIKKRMAEDAEAPEGEDELVEDPEEEAEDAECVEKEEEEVVTDHAPRIPITVKDHAAKGSLSALFDMAKRGNR